MMIQYFNKIEGLLFQSEKTWHYHTSLRKHSKTKFYVKTLTVLKAIIALNQPEQVCDWKIY